MSAAILEKERNRNEQVDNEEVQASRDGNSNIKDEVKNESNGEERESLSQYAEVVVEERAERFVDTKSDNLLKSGNLNELNCFYQGDLVHERMAAVRHSIYHIRQNWSKFDQFLSNLESFMESKAVQSGGLSDGVKSIFARRRNWKDIEDLQESFSSLQEEFNVIYTYTTVEGHKEIFKISDGIFRQDSSVNYKDLVTNAVFLVELINIDLFNYVLKYPKFSNFEGVVYRGMAIPPKYFTIFESLMKEPLNKRYISIPLGLWSSSMKLEKAMEFIEDEVKNNPENVPLLMKIHVLNVDKEYIEYYRNKFQKKSVVSSICAVPIYEISRFPAEAEVLLRGGFFHAINFYNSEINNVKLKVLELVMLNSNRDHVSNPVFMNEEEDKQARALFGTMVGVTRNRFIVDYCKKNNLSEDLGKYEILLEEGEAKLKTLMGKSQ